MATEEGNWAPKSPDLSLFLPSGGPDLTIAQTPTSAFTSAPDPTFVPGPGSASGYLPSTYNPHHAQAQAPGQAQAHAQPESGHYDQPQTHQTYSAPAYNNYNLFTAASPNSSRPEQQYFPPPQEPQNHFPPIPQPAYGIPDHLQTHAGPQSYYSYTEPSQAQFETSQLPATYEQIQPSAGVATAAMPPRRSAASQAAQQPEIMASPVRTKFPTARIKRIMQADEEVGKVAQQTPIAVGKALELFMVQIVSKSADVAKDNNSKRITAQMLKQAVEVNPQWDFLQEIVAKVSEKEDREPKNKGKPNENTDSEEEPEAQPKKKGRGGPRKKKEAA